MTTLHQAAHAGVRYFVENHTLFDSAACVPYGRLLGVIAINGESAKFGLLYPICSLSRRRSLAAPRDTECGTLVE